MNIKERIITWIKDYLTTKYDFIQEIWIYGSYARGDNKINSDFDIMCVIPKEKFNKQTILEIRRETPGYDLPDLDIHFCIESLDLFEYKNDALILNVKKDGVKIWDQKISTNLPKTTFME